MENNFKTILFLPLRETYETIIREISNILSRISFPAHATKSKTKIVTALRSQ